MKSYLICLTMVLFLAGHGYAYDARASYSVDQILDRSLEELKESMSKAKQSNEELKSQNQLLREYVAEMEENISAVSSKEVSVEAAVDAPPSDEVLLAQEQRLYRARLDNLTARQNRLAAQNGRLTKNVKFYAQENKKTEQLVAQLKKEISDIQLALKSSEQTKVVKVDPNSLKLQKQLAAKKDNIRLLGKKLAAQKDSLKVPAELKDKYVSENAAIKESIIKGRDELALLRRGEQVLGREQKSLDGSWADDSIVRREINELEEIRGRFKLAMNNSKKATAEVKATTSNDLAKILKIYQDQQALLQRKLDALRPGSSLLVRKQSLFSEQKRLEGQIALEKKTSVGAGTKSASAADLQATRGRIVELKKKIASSRTSSPLQKRNQDLAGQVAVLQQDLQRLRENPQSQTAMSSANVKEEISHLEARRVMLANAVQDIYEKYNLNELSEQDVLARESRLEQYFETLRMENSALQEKLLTLQMRQDKSSSAVQ